MTQFDRVKRVSAVLAAGLLAAAVFAFARRAETAPSEPRKVAMVVMDSPNLPWAASRLLTAMVFSKQLQKTGVKVELVFYSFAVQWLSLLEELPSAKDTEEARRRASKGTTGFFLEYIGKDVLVQKYKSLREGGIPVALCPGSAERTGLMSELSSKNVPLVKVQSDEKGEMNIAPLVLEGYQVWVF